MIPAQSHPVFTPLVRAYIRASVQGHFSSVRVLVEAPDATPQATLLQSTHVSWWDGYLGVVLCQHMGWDFRVLMLSRQLSKYGFLAFAGAFGFDPMNAADTRDALRYANTELNNAPSTTPKACLILPAGEIVSPHLRPAPFKPGVAMLAAQSAPMRVRSVAMRLEHFAHPKPVALLRVSAPRIVQPGERIKDLALVLQHDLETQTALLEGELQRDDLGEYQTVLRGALSVQERWDAVRGMRPNRF